MSSCEMVVHAVFSSCMSCKSLVAKALGHTDFSLDGEFSTTLCSVSLDRHIREPRCICGSRLHQLMQ